MSTIRRMLGRPQDLRVRIVGQVAALVPYKGQMVLLEAARTVIKQEPDTWFLFVGYVRDDLSYRDRLQQRASELGIQDRVTIISYSGHIGDVWKAIDIHVHASLLDSLPNAIMEGMALAKPAVVTNIGGIVEMVEPERTALLVPPNDPAALSRAILRLLRDPELAERLSRAARQRYEVRYQPEVMARRLEECFSEIVCRSSGLNSLESRCFVSQGKR